MTGYNQWLIRDVYSEITVTDDEICDIAKAKMKQAGISTGRLHFRLYKKSVDARKKEHLMFVSTVLAEADDLQFSISSSQLQKCKGALCPNLSITVNKGTESLCQRPIVVGMGPAGLFCALQLSQEGYKPIIMDRGASVYERVNDVRHFWETGVLQEDSNVQFGAGGAGTFSDGKLLTRINDVFCSYVLEMFHRFGAPDDILYQAKPHIGTDVLRIVVDNILLYIQSLGGEVMYHCKVFKISPHSSGVTVSSTNGDFETKALILAIGNAARDTFAHLIKNQFSVYPKPISVGVRIEHLQEEIDKALWGKYAGHPALQHAEYALSDTTRERGVYTFCMCPGGEVVAAASEKGGVVVNGMSNHNRSGKNANSAVLVSVPVSDYEMQENNLALGAIAYQRKIEQKAFAIAGSNYYAPAQSCGSFLSGSSPALSNTIVSTYGGGNKVQAAKLSLLFPKAITYYLEYAIHSFGNKIKGFDDAKALLTGPETRTSSPVRIHRTEALLMDDSPFIYPCGEGAGYAGGITSSAVDGLKVANAIIRRFAPLD